PEQVTPEEQPERVHKEKDKPHRVHTGRDAKIELNEIYNEDNISLISRMPDDFIDLTVTSPPYDNLREYKGYTFDFETLAKEVYRVTKPGGVVVWVVGDATINGSETGTSFRQALYFMDVGFNLHDTMIYEKNKVHVYDPRQHRYKSSSEYMFVFSKDKPKTFNAIKDIKNKTPGKKVKVSQRLNNGSIRSDREIIHKEYQARGNVWKYVTGNENSFAYEHPAVFPLQLAKDIIISWSDKRDLVYDPFMGSGTTAIAALETERQFIGAEIAKEYVEISNERIKNHTTQTDIFDVLEGN